MPKFMCAEGHLHNEQWRADNCAACKRNSRRRVLRAVAGTARLHEMLPAIGVSIESRMRAGSALPDSRDRAVRRRLIRKAAR